MTEVASNAGLVSFGGLASNLDTNKIVEALVDAQRQPMKKLTQRQNIIQMHEDLVQAVEDRLTVLTQTARGMESIGRLMSPRADSSNPAVVTAVATERAHPGTHVVEVRSLATAQRVLSGPISSASDPSALSPGTISWQDGNASHEVVVDDSKTLSDVSSEISLSRAGIASSVLYDGANYRLSVRGTKVGNGAELGLQDTTNLGLGLAENRLQTAQDAQFVLDEAISMTRPTNIIDDVVEGVTLRLTAAGPATTVSVSTDSARLAEGIGKFVEHYNLVRESIDAAIRPGQNFEKERLVGDSTLRNLADALQRIVASAVKQSPSQSQSASPSLGSIGVNSNKEGRLAIDSVKLEGAIDDDVGSVARLFGRTRGAAASGLAGSIARVCEQYGAPMTGILPMRVRSMHKESATHESRLAQMQSNLDRFEQGQRKKFAELERTMTVMKSQNEKLQAQLKSLQK